MLAMLLLSQFIVFAIIFLFNLGTELFQGYKKLVIETNTSNPV